MEVSAGRIELVVGPMFAGKTTEMLRRVDRAELAQKRVVVMKYSHDTRYSQDKVSTHDRKMRTAVPCNVLMPHKELCLQYDVIGIDEGQFFPDVVEFSEELANQGKTVIVAGLDGDFRRKPFGRVLDLIAKCEFVTKLSAICTETGNEAPFTKRTVKNDDIEVIGGSEMYQAASRSSFFGETTKGEIHLTMGPVRSGKTTELKRILTRHKFAGRKPLLIAHPDVDTESIKSQSFDVRIVSELPPISDITGYDIIGIDECQRYENIVEWSDEVANLGKFVEASALDGTCDRNAYKNIVELFPRCEKVQKLDSVCPITGLPAPFSMLTEGRTLIPISRCALLQAHRIMKVIHE